MTNVGGIIMAVKLYDCLSTILVKPVVLEACDNGNYDLRLDGYDPYNGECYKSIVLLHKDVYKFINFSLKYLALATSSRYVSVCFIDHCIEIADGLYSGACNVEVRLDRKKDKVYYRLHSILWEKKNYSLCKIKKHSWLDVFKAMQASKDEPDIYFTSYISKKAYKYKEGKMLKHYDILDKKESVKTDEVDINKPDSEETVSKEIVSEETIFNTELKDLSACKELEGQIISFEGGEGAGKTTQIKQLEKTLLASGFKVLSLREPGGSKIAEELRGIILDKDNADMDAMCETMCFAAARAQLFNEKILPALKEKYVVLLDRFVDTSYVYQGMCKGVGLEVVRTINNFAISNMLPACTFYFDLDPEIGMKRISDNGRETNKYEEVDISFHKKVRSNYKKLAQSKRYCVIDASRDVDSIYVDITNALLDRFS